MNIVVCVKQVLDPEVPPKAFKIDSEAKEPVQGDAQLVLGPFDENALEVALQLRDALDDGSTVTVLTLGEETAEEGLRQALSVTADEAILLNDEAFDDSDYVAKAYILAQAIRQLDGGADLVLCGRQAGDWDAGQTGALLAEELGYGCVPFVAQAGPGDDGVEVIREGTDGRERVAVDLPAVLTVTNDEANVLRLAKVKDIMMANRKDIPVWSASDIEVDPNRIGPDAALVSVKDLFIPEVDSDIEIIEGEDGEEKARRLAQRLREEKII